MKIAVISDVHGNLLALQAVLADIARQGVDQTVNLGDLLSGPLQPFETAELLMAEALLTIRGNHERQLLARLEPGPSSAKVIDTTTSDSIKLKARLRCIIFLTCKYAHTQCYMLRP